MQRILVAENDTGERDLMAFHLEQAGYAVRTCATGDAALDAIDRDVTAVVLEERLPGLSGLEVCRRLRAVPATAGIPILVVSNTGTEAETAAAFAAGADDWLAEPVRPREFQLRVRALVARWQRQPRRAADTHTH